MKNYNKNFKVRVIIICMLSFLTIICSFAIYDIKKKPISENSIYKIGIMSKNFLVANSKGNLVYRYVNQGRDITLNELGYKNDITALKTMIQSSYYTNNKVDKCMLGVIVIYIGTIIIIKLIKHVKIIKDRNECEIKKLELEEKEIEDTMNYALENGEFEVYLQAKYNISLEKPIGAEALVRWNSPSKGLLSPFKFIPIFESNGFIVKLDMYVLEKVCSKMNEWQHERIVLIPISVNMSRIHIEDITNFTEEISRILNKYDISSELIEIEITESILIKDIDRMIEAMNRLRNLGFRLSLDDFGSGYSSLRILKDLPVDIIKLDKEFLDSNYSNKKSEIIISNIVKMAKELNLMIVAEGVETEEQAAFLNKLGCNIVQGYLYSKPIPMDLFREKELTNLDS